MTWVRIDDGALHHEKLLAAGPDAITLWLSGLCYANRHTTDGALAKGTLLALYPSETLPPARAKKAAARLVEVGLWLETPSGWCIRNYERYQREAMSVTRDRRREADKASKAEKRGTKSAVDPPTVGAMSDSDTPPTSSRSESEPSTVETVSAPSRARDPVPARPGPSRPDQNSSRGSVPDQVAPGRADLRDTLASAWRVGFVRRFGRIAGGTHGGPAGAHMAALIDAALAQPDPVPFVERALDGFFSTPRMATMRPAFAPRWLAEDPVGYAAHSTRPAGETDAQLAELARSIPRLEVL